MTCLIKITPEAQEDIQGALDYIAIDNTEAARSVLAAIRRIFDLLVDFPEIAPPCLRFKGSDVEDIRMYPVPEYRNYIIFHHYSDGVATIIAVVHAARDSMSVLMGRPGIKE